MRVTQVGEAFPGLAYSCAGPGGITRERHLDRIYFGKDGDQVVILLAGGTKKRQEDDIEAAQARWEDYKRRKRKET